MSIFIYVCMYLNMFEYVGTLQQTYLFITAHTGDRECVTAYNDADDDDDYDKRTTTKKTLTMR